MRQEIPYILCKDLCEGNLLDITDLHPDQYVTDYQEAHFSAREILTFSPLVLGDNCAGVGSEGKYLARRLAHSTRA